MTSLIQKPEQINTRRTPWTARR